MARSEKTIIYDVIVVGGGLAGLSLTALLATNDMRVLCLDREAAQEQLKAAFDGRTTAISWGSHKVLTAAGVWGTLKKQACPINTIHILDGDSPVLLDFDRSEMDNRAFGWIVENRFMRKTLLEKVLSLKTAAHLSPAQVEDIFYDADFATVRLSDGRQFKTRLVVGADGRASFTREQAGIGTRAWPYKQTALTFIVTHTKPHGNIAVENFRSTGPFAILPMADAPDGAHRSCVVWTESGPDKKSARHFDEEAFNAALQARFPERYGSVKLAGKIFSYPLGLVHAHDYIAPRTALVADAAHGIHPIAGQGLNLGFRDIAVLAELVSAAVADGRDPGDEKLLRHYQRARRPDNMAMAGATDLLTRLFSNDITPVRAVRKAGLRAAARLPFAKRFFMRQAMGVSGLLPSLINDEAA